MSARPDIPPGVAPEAPRAEAGAAALAVARVRLAAALRAAFLNHVWTRGAGAGSDPLDALTDPADTPEAEAAFRLADPGARELAARLAAVEAELADTPPPALRWVQAVFHLEPCETACLHLALAARADPAIAALLGHVAPEGGADYPTEALAARLFLGQETGAWRPDGAAARWRLLHLLPMGPGRPHRIALDEGLWAWLDGRSAPAPELLGALWGVRAPEPLPHWPVAATVAEARRLMEQERQAAITIAVAGGPQSGRKSFAAIVARDLSLPLFAVDLARIAPQDRLEALILAHRHAWLTESAPILLGEANEYLTLPADLAPFPVVFVARDAAAPAEGAAPSRARAKGPDISVRLDPPDAETRAHLWRRLCPPAATWPEAELLRLADTHLVQPGAIAAIAARAPQSAAEAAAQLKRRNADLFGALARQVECPFGLDDLVLPERLKAHLTTLLHEARTRNRLWDRPEMQRLFPNGRGLVALFAGPPGTGKTMAAQVLAAELELDLYRVEVSTLVSKYIGETMENIQRLFDLARETDVVLLFDEADGFFARRTELSSSNDRHANQDTGHLLQAIEAFPGIAVLSSNRRRNIDEAFQRRLRYIVDFPAPDEAARRMIWAKVLGPVFGAEALARLAPSLDRVAQRVEMTGAQIKQAALTAHFAADRSRAPVSVAHLLDGIDAELMKEGRALTPRDREDLAGGAEGEGAR